MRSDLRIQTPEDNHIEVLKSLIASGDLSVHGMVKASYALAKELDDIGAYDLAFKNYRKSAQLRRQHLKYDIADNITRPTLVIQGANDPRVLQVESDELVAAIQANEVPVEYVVFPDEGHGFRKRVNQVTASEAYVRFLNAYLRGESPGE